MASLHNETTVGYRVTVTAVITGGLLQIWLFVHGTHDTVVGRVNVSCDELLYLYNDLLKLFGHIQAIRHSSYVHETRRQNSPTWYGVTASSAPVTDILSHHY